MRLSLLLLLCTAVAAVSASLSEGTEKCFCQLTGTIDDCCCSIEDVDSLNRHVLPLITRLTESTFFRFYRVDMDRECPFWKNEDEKCKSEQCAVETCPEDQLPGPLKEENKIIFNCNDHGEYDELRQTITAEEHHKLQQWQAHDDSLQDFCDVGDSSLHGHSHYVNLLDNPERFTGYSGNSAARIWRSIYSENCFKPENETVRFLTSSVVNEMCMEKRVFFRIVSALHATINLHVAAHYPTTTSSYLGETTTWSANLTLFERFFSPDKTFGEGPQWLKNVYFTYMMLIRAVRKAAPMWRADKFHTGIRAEDEEVAELVTRLITTAPTTCPETFDEAAMFRDGNELRDEFREHFRNISRIMDCVGCSTCKLWGKLKVHGLGTAMKILFTDNGQLQLKRNEVVALFNTVGQFAMALGELDMFRKLQGGKGAPSPPSKPKSPFG